MIFFFFTEHALAFTIHLITPFRYILELQDLVEGPWMCMLRSLCIDFQVHIRQASLPMLKGPGECFNVVIDKKEYIKVRNL